MVDSNCLDVFHIEQMVQNEDNEILQVMQNKEEIYKITFADSQRSTDMESLLRVSSSHFSNHNSVKRSSKSNVNLYNKNHRHSPLKRNLVKNRKQRPRSPFKTPNHKKISPQKAYQYVYQGKEFKKIPVNEISENEDFGDYEDHQWRNKFNRFKMETAGDFEQGSMEDEHFEADVSEEEMGEEKFGYGEDGNFENSFDNSD